MKDISDGKDLVAIARDALVKELLPLLTKEQRYVGLMIANALAIAIREDTSAADTEHGEAVRLSALLEASASAPASSDFRATPAALPTLRREMCAAIRAGRFDHGERSAALSAHLAITAAAWLAISNPKALRAAGAP
jgi:hypothetical protein